MSRERGRDDNTYRVFFSFEHPLGFVIDVTNEKYPLFFFVNR